MTAFMTPFKDQVFALLRIAVGFNFLTHGTQKLFGFPGAAVDAPSFIINIAGPIELVGGALIMLGLFTRWTAFLLSLIHLSEPTRRYAILYAGVSC